MIPKSLGILLAVVASVQCTSIDCSLVRCQFPVCAEGQEVFFPPDQCCGSCRNCSDAECPLFKCLDGDILQTPPGKCCPECTTCDLDECTLPPCAPGSTVFTPVGQCCPTCGPPLDPCFSRVCNPFCPEGEESFQVEGECCPRCRPSTLDCRAVLCLLPDCAEDEERFTPEGKCCPKCRKVPQPDCSAVLCRRPVCPIGEEIFTPPGQCCPRCRPITLDCSAVRCLIPVCGTDEELFTPSGQCCPACRSCSTVLCISPNCGPFEEIFTPPGECCSQCRSRPVCRIGGQVQQGCRTCPATCRNPGLICTLQCVFGCGCPSGQLIDEDNNKCVEPKDCPNPCALIDCAPFSKCLVGRDGEGFCERSCEIGNGGCPEDTECTVTPIACLVPPCPPGQIQCVPRSRGPVCPPECSKTFCRMPGNKKALCSVPGPREIPGCTGQCQLSYCNACYFSEEPLPLPGNCSADCAEGLTTDNKCFRSWASCVRRAHRITHGLAVSRPAEDFKCYRPPCPLRG